MEIWGHQEIDTFLRSFTCSLIFSKYPDIICTALTCCLEVGFFNCIKEFWAQSSVQFICSVVSNSLQPHELQHARPPCPTPTPGVHPNPCPLSRWCHPTISSVIPFSSCPQSFPPSGSFQMSQLFASCGQSIGVSASTSVLWMNIQDWYPLRWTGWISLQSKGLSRVFSQHHSSKASILLLSAFFIVQLSHPYMTKLEVVFVLGTNNRVLFVTLSSLFFHITTYIGCLLEEIYLIPFNNWVESWTFGGFQMLVVICGVCCFC